MDDFRMATGPILWWLRRTGFSGITMPWGKVYIVPERFFDEGLRAHEAIHLEQLRRMGAMRFSLTYLWLLLRYGYANHPMEVEARTRSGSW